ncbi:thyrotropin-releasing hormone receptor-like [Brachionus plicatilis]|uniref:Thyrotropin-releasing hormone receptor-like n=1 Tax=Brachionus plicatilis TaxID=10195 RepID=A0A3M7S901_BRAPC|nr:thyrotropin-releasing hormone receptor-like [Brachionus plicatilis]
METRGMRQGYSSYGSCSKTLQQANYILAALAIADNGFLISLLVVNLKSFVNVNIFDNSQIGCKLSVYITYLFSFLSTWYVVEFSIERLIAVYFPIKRITICKKTTNKFSIFMLMAISLIIYSFALVTSGIESSNDEKNSCVTLTKWFDLVQLIAFIDMLITMVIPFLIIFISNISIVYKLMGFGYSSNFPIETHRFSSNASTELSELNWRKISIKSPNKNAMKLNSTQNRFYKQTAKGDAPRANQSRINLGNHLTKANEVKRIQKYSRTTRMLLIVSTTFLLLHMPIAVCKAWYFVKSSLIKNRLGNETESFETSSSEEMFERLSYANPKPATLGPISRNENAMNTIQSNQASQTVQVMANQN